MRLYKKFMSDCIFCKIIHNEIPSQKVYEDEKVVAFLDIHPVNQGHVLVVPKKHCEDLLDADVETLQSVITAVPKIANAILDALDFQGFNLGVNNGPVAGQVVPHLHVHIMPRTPDDGYRLWSGRPYGFGEMEEVAEKILAKMKKKFS